MSGHKDEITELDIKVKMSSEILPQFLGLLRGIEQERRRLIIWHSDCLAGRHVEFIWPDSAPVSVAGVAVGDSGEFKLP